MREDYIPRFYDRQASLKRRRRQAMSGAIPAKLADSFTMGEIAVLTVIAREVQENEVCTFPIDKIAALAGVCRTTCHNAVRLAVRLGLIERRERRHKGDRSETNILKVISKAWIAWLCKAEDRRMSKRVIPKYYPAKRISGFKSPAKLDA